TAHEDAQISQAFDITADHVTLDSLVIDASGEDFMSASSAVVRARNVSNARVEGGELVGPGEGAPLRGVVLSGSAEGRVLNSTLSGFLTGVFVSDEGVVSGNDFTDNFVGIGGPATDGLQVNQNTFAEH